MIVLDDAWVEQACFGGGILGGGGGGSVEEGIQLGQLALKLGYPTMLDSAEVPDDSLIATVSAVGAPSRKQRPIPSHYVRAVKLLMDHTGKEIAGLMTNEMGGSASINGLVQSAILQIPLIDAACNGRAYPIGTMGAMGLSVNSDFVSEQAAAGGSKKKGTYVEIYGKGSLPILTELVIKASYETGGLIAVARHPLPASYIKANAAVGALTQAVRLGKAYLSGQTGEEKIHRAVEVLGGKVVARANVDSVKLTVQQGLDVGKVVIGDLEITFWNEYMTLEQQGERLATFPDLIMTMDAETGSPISSADLEKGQRISVIVAPKENLILGASMRDRQVFRDVERAIGKEIIQYVFPKEDSQVCSSSR